MKSTKLILISAVIIGLFMGIHFNWFGNMNFISEMNIEPPDSIEKKPELSSPITNVPEGWGFVKSKDGKTPGIAAHQQQLIKKYDALFVGNTKKKQVTLTFDMGYEKEGLTPIMLETLKKHNVKASFFVTSYWIKKNKELAKKVVADGHLLCNHTCKHKSLPTLTEDQIKSEISGWEKVAKEELGYTQKYKYMRPPMGEYSEKSLKVTKELGYKTAFWSIAMRDWLPMGGSEKAVQGVVNYLHNGAVVLLHGNSEDVVKGLDEIISGIKEKGFKIVPLNEIEK